MKILPSILVSFVVTLIACSSTQQKSSDVPKAFRDYWYQGKAELDSYELNQARYGEIHEGHAVLIYVAEDFSPQSRTKAGASSSKKIPILKCNFTKKFTTGIYPYSMMSSIHSAVDKLAHPELLKITTTSQEWCGHTFMNIDWNQKKYDVELRSYFPSEAETDFTLDPVFLEDDLWTSIRTSPESLPVGETSMLPSTMYLRLMHKPVEAMAATAKKQRGDSTTTYSVNYNSLDRTLSITYENDFPHKILGWTETYKSGWGPSAEILTTTATLKETLMSDYWNKNKVSDGVLRKDLGLED